MPLLRSGSGEMTGNKGSLARFESGMLQFMVSVLSSKPRGLSRQTPVVCLQRWPHVAFTEDQSKQVKFVLTYS